MTHTYTSAKNYREKIVELYWTLETVIQEARAEEEVTFGYIQSEYTTTREAYTWVQDIVLEMADGDVGDDPRGHTP